MKSAGLYFILILSITACGSADGYRNTMSELDATAPRQNTTTTTTTSTSTSTSITTTTLDPGHSTEEACVGSGSTCHWKGPYLVTPSDSRRYIKFATIPNGNYRKVSLKLKVKITQFTPSPSAAAGVHNLFWLTRNHRNNDAIGMAGLKPNKDLMLRHGVDVSHGLKSKEIQKFKSLALGETYQVEYIWDSWAGIAEMKIKALSGAVLLTFNKYPPNVPVLELRGRDYVGVGLSDFYGAVEVPSLGWEYSDLTLELSP